MSAQLSDLVLVSKHLQRLEMDLEATELWAAQLKRDIAHFSQNVIPDVMADIGIDEIKLDTGEKVVKEVKYFANISQDRSEKAFAWLREHQKDAIIKTGVGLTFTSSLGDKVDMTILENFLNEHEILFDKKEAVHPSTLKTFVRESLEGTDSKNFPRELFGVYVVEEVYVEKPKIKK